MSEQNKSPNLNRLQERFAGVRGRTAQLATGLSDADATVQSMEDASPAKWHLAHTSWFFETFLLLPYGKDYRCFDTSYNYLFNSYYETVGSRHPRPQRGMLTRPSLGDVLDYRHHVDDAMMNYLDTDLPEGVVYRIELGLNHEQQHQELFLTDILHLFSQNPLKPAFRKPVPQDIAASDGADTEWQSFEGGLYTIGYEGSGFCFDCETPPHEFLLRPFLLANRSVTNADWFAFMDDGGYEQPLLWLADGWDVSQSEKWFAPLYWEKIDGVWHSMTLRGLQPVDPSAPVAHISYYEANAFANWSGARLPTEQEWEVAAGDKPVQGNFAESEALRPLPQEGVGLAGLFGDVWEWTQSPFTSYPGFRVSPGAVGEYNGKFMSGQMVLKGGSCVTPGGHVCKSYRNFFHPQKRWQFSGLRLAKDC